jgi:hypothetical protein
MKVQTLEHYIARLGEVLDDYTLSISADGRIATARAAANINMARRQLLREFLTKGVAETHFATRVEIATDSSDSYVHTLPPRVTRVQAIVGSVDNGDPVYEGVYSRLRDKIGYLVEPRKIRWFGRTRPTETLYAVTIDEPVAMSRGTAVAGSTTTITLASSASVGRTIEDDDYYNGARVYIVSGTGSGQTGNITDYVGSTRVATATFSTAPDITSVYTIMDELPIVMADAVVLRAAVNISRTDASMDHALARFLGEYERSEKSALGNLRLPSTSIVAGTRRAVDWVD